MTILDDAKHFRPLPIISTLALSCMLCACIEHRTSIDIKNAEGDLLVNGNPVDHEHLEDSQSLSAVHGLPVSQHAVAWRQDPKTGQLLWGSVEVDSPLPWWQRFPFDFFTDLAPVTLTAEDSRTLELNPSRTWSIADIDRQESITTDHWRSEQHLDQADTNNPSNP